MSLFRLDRKFYFKNTLYTKRINIIIYNVGRSIILRLHKIERTLVFKYYLNKFQQLLVF